MKWFDKFFEQTTRDAARTISRRNAIVRVGKLLVGSAFVLPVLPFDRVALAGESARPNKKAALGDTDCDYWRYCALDGFLCTCCGGSVSSCPAGTEPSKVSWIGTCHSPQGWQGLPDHLQRLLWRHALRALPLQRQRRGAARLSDGRAQRYQLVHGQLQQHVSLHGRGHSRGR